MLRRGEEGGAGSRKMNRNLLGRKEHVPEGTARASTGTQAGWGDVRRTGCGSMRADWFEVRMERNTGQLLRGLDATRGVLTPSFSLSGTLV